MVSLNDVLLAYSNIPVDDPIAEIWGRGLQRGYEIIEYTGTLPITIVTDGTALIDYCIYGNTVQDGTPTPENPVDVVGCGVRTENLFDGQLQQGFYSYTTGSYILSNNYVCTRLIPCTDNTTYTFGLINTGGGSRNYGYVFFDSTRKRISSDYSVVMTEGDVVTYTATSPRNAAFLAINVSYGKRQEKVVSPSDITNFMLNLGSEALPYEPYGYKLPMVSNSNAIDIYIGDTPLWKDEYVDSNTGKIYRIVDGTLTPIDPPVPLPEIPTSEGVTVIDYDGTPKPSQMYVKYRR